MVYGSWMGTPSFCSGLFSCLFSQPANGSFSFRCCWFPIVDIMMQSVCLLSIVEAGVKTSWEGFRFPRCCLTLIRPPQCVLSYLTFTLGRCGFSGRGVGDVGVSVRARPSGKCEGEQKRHLSDPTAPGPFLLGLLQGLETCRVGRTWQGTQLRSDILSLGLSSCCSLRPDINSAELLEVSQHARTHTASTTAPLCLSPLWQ